MGATRVSNFLFFRILHSLVCPSAYSTKLLFCNHSFSVSHNILELKTYSPNVSERTSPIQRVPSYNLVLLSIASGYRKISSFFEVFYFCSMPQTSIHGLQKIKDSSLQSMYFSNCLSIHVLRTVYTIHTCLIITVCVSNAHSF